MASPTWMNMCADFHLFVDVALTMRVSATATADRPRAMIAVKAIGSSLFNSTRPPLGLKGVPVAPGLEQALHVPRPIRGPSIRRVVPYAGLHAWSKRLDPIVVEIARFVDLHVAPDLLRTVAAAEALPVPPAALPVLHPSPEGQLHPHHS